jgi:hypothetical protein
MLNGPEELAAIVTGRGDMDERDADRCQFLRESGCIGIGDVAQQKLGAEGDDVCPHDSLSRYESQLPVRAGTQGKGRQSFFPSDGTLSGAGH